jgi:hypothetical protein
LVFGPPLGAFGVGHEIHSLPDVRSADARSAGIETPAGVSLVIQVRSYKVEPREAVKARYLFAKDCDRSSCFDESKPSWPKVPRIVERFAFAGRAEGLTGAGASPDFAVVGPSGEPECVTPNSNTAEEMALGVASQIVGLNIEN